MITMNSDTLSQQGPSNSQSSQEAPPNDGLIPNICSMPVGFPVAMLTTVGPDGSLRSRPMAALDQPIINGEVWFFTEYDTATTNKIGVEHKVSLAYADPACERYVSLSVLATIVRDPELVRRFWNEAAKAWFPNGPDDPAIVLLRVRIHGGNAWDSRGEFSAESGHAKGLSSTAAYPQEVAIEKNRWLGK